MIAGAMRAKVELDTEPTREMNRSNLNKIRIHENFVTWNKIDL